MTGKTLRVSLRWAHLVIAAVLGTDVYSPWGDDDWFQNLVAFAVFPLLVITGVLMWQQARVMKRLRS